MDFHYKGDTGYLKQRPVFIKKEGGNDQGEIDPVGTFMGHAPIVLRSLQVRW